MLILYLLQFLSPLIMLGIGFSWHKSTSVPINPVYGYRTKYSMKSQETWNYAHMTYGKYMRVAGWVSLIFAILFSIPYFLIDKGPQTVGAIAVLFVQILVFLALLFVVEHQLREKFDDNGNFKLKSGTRIPTEKRKSTP